MLDTLLEAEAKGLIDQSGIQEEVDTFTFEGHDTTSAGIIFSLLLLANNPEIQEQLYEEIKLFKDDRNGEELTTDDFANMKYLDRVLKECFRIYPPVPFISRILTENLIIDDIILPPDTICHVHIFDLHRDPEQFPDPEKFDPDRFLPENTANRHTFAYVPFSAGPRNCIGQKFALLEIKTIISNILWNFKLFPVTRREDVVFIIDIILRSKDSVKIKFRKRYLSLFLFSVRSLTI